MEIFTRNRHERSTKIHEHLWNTMNVLRRQEANLEPSRGFYRGSRLHLQKSEPTNMQMLSPAAEAVACISAAVRSAPLAGVLGTRVEFQNSTNVLELT